MCSCYIIKKTSPWNLISFSFSFKSTKNGIVIVINIKSNGPNYNPKQWSRSALASGTINFVQQIIKLEESVCSNKNQAKIKHSNGNRFSVFRNFKWVNYSSAIINID